MMIKRQADKKWFPFWVDKWIFGSMRIEFNLEERAIWIDLLAMASKDDGYIRANEDIPYPLEQLAGTLRIPVDKLRKAVNKFVKKGKLIRLPNRTLLVDKWEKYQLSESYLRVKKHREKTKSNGKTLHTPKKALPYYIRRDKNIIDNKKERPKKSYHTEQEKQILKELFTVKGLSAKKIGLLIKYLRELAIEFPDVDCLEEIKLKVAWWRDNPLTKKSNMHLQMRNWFVISQKGFNEAKKQHRVGKDYGLCKTKYPTLFLGNVYALLRKQEKDGNKYADLIFALTDDEAKQAAIKYKDTPAEFIKFLESRK